VLRVYQGQGITGIEIWYINKCSNLEINMDIYIKSRRKISDEKNFDFQAVTDKYNI